MKIKVLRNLGAELPNYKENQVVEVSEAEGDRLIKQGLAEQTTEPEGFDLVAVPDQPAIARAKSERGTVERATEDLEDFKERGKRGTAKSAATQPATPETIGTNPHSPPPK